MLPEKRRDALPGTDAQGTRPRKVLEDALLRLIRARSLPRSEQVLKAKPPALHVVFVRSVALVRIRVEDGQRVAADELDKEPAEELVLNRREPLPLAEVAVALDRRVVVLIDVVRVVEAHAEDQVVDDAGVGKATDAVLGKRGGVG